MLLRGIKEGMHSFGKDIATLVNSILLSIVYVIGVGMSAVFARIGKKKFLDLSNEKKTTYWQQIGLKKKPKNTYFRQY